MFISDDEYIYFSNAFRETHKAQVGYWQENAISSEILIDLRVFHEEVPTMNGVLLKQKELAALIPHMERKEDVTISNGRVVDLHFIYFLGSNTFTIKEIVITVFEEPRQQYKFCLRALSGLLRIKDELLNTITDSRTL